MNAMLSSRRRHYITGVSFCLLVLALIAGMTGCAGIEYGLAISSTAGGSVTTPGEGTLAYDTGAVVSLVATPLSGYRFVNWTGDVGTVANVNAASTTITIDDRYFITANFEELPPVQYDLTISSTAGGSVTTPGEGTFAYNTGAVVSLVATPLSGYRFVNWTGNVGTIANVNAASTTITVDDNYSITANFEQIEGTYYTLTMAVTGSGSTSPAVGQHSYAAGTVVAIIATPAGGHQFVNWTGNVGTIADENAASTTITMNSNYSITANFETIPPGQYSLTISSGAGGSVTTPGEGTFIYGSGTVVNLVATPSGSYEFVNWTGNVGTIANVNAASTTITMNDNYSITANLDAGPPVPYNLIISSSAGGSVTAPGEGTFGYGSGTVVNLVATPASGYQFVNWTGNVGTIANVNAASTTITMSGNYSITANFAVIPPVQYSLTIFSTSGGSVTTPGEGIFTRNAGTVVNLVATPAGGYRFVNWTGNVGTIANVNAASTTITMNGSYSITANFEEIPEYELTISSTAGGSVTSPGEGTFDYDAGTVVSLAAIPTSGYAFVNWTGNTGSITNVNAAYTTITMNDNYSVTANFEVGDWVFFPDPELEAALREAIGKPTGRIYKSDLEGLISFSATGRSITDLSGLEHCINLVSLNLHDNKISDISPLAGLTKLEWLDLSYNRISDISPLAGLTNLKWLYLYNNQIGNISPLANLSNLLYLYLHSNQISNISPLANLTNLTRLLLFSNQISDISPLTNLTKLTWLYLQKNQISNIGPLANLTNLTQLDLSDNQVSGIAPLANLTNLLYLSLHSNQISDISLLANFTNLMWLYLQNDLITNIYPLVQNGGLGTGDRVYLDGNPLSDDSINIYIPELVARGVIVSY